jgi:hypothetical protein
MTLEDFKTRYTYNPSTDRLGGGGFVSRLSVTDRKLNR